MTVVSARPSSGFLAGAGWAVRTGGVLAAAALSRRWLASGFPKTKSPIAARAMSSIVATALTAIVARRQGRIGSIRSCTCSIARSEFVLRAPAPSSPARSDPCQGQSLEHVPKRHDPEPSSPDMPARATTGTVPDMSRRDRSAAQRLWTGWVPRMCDFPSTPGSRGHVWRLRGAYVRQRHAAVPGFRAVGGLAKRLAKRHLVAAERFDEAGDATRRTRLA